MTLRWLAGEIYLDIALWNHVSVSTFCFIVDNIIADLDSVLRIEFLFSSVDLLQISSRVFSLSNRSSLTGCIGALDGIAIEIEEPSRGSVSNLSTFYNRKDAFCSFRSSDVR